MAATRSSVDGAGPARDRVTSRPVDPPARACRREVAEAVAVGRPFVSLAAPTHAGGWIDPAVLVKRSRAGPPPSTLDLVAAILRLAPEGRDAALASAAGPDGRERRGRALRAWWRRVDRRNGTLVGRGRARSSSRRGRPGGREAPSGSRTGRGPGRTDPALHRHAGPSQLDLGDQDGGRTAPARRDRCRPADRADAPHPVVVLLERAIRPGHVPLDGDDPACLSRTLVRDRCSC